jgi:hypothetical protein
VEQTDSRSRTTVFLVCGRLFSELDGSLRTFRDFVLLFVCHVFHLLSDRFNTHFSASSHAQTTRLIQTITGKVYYPLLVAAAATIPLQGIPNGIVFLYPKYAAMRERHKDWTMTQAFLAVLSGVSSRGGGRSSHLSM